MNATPLKPLAGEVRYLAPISGIRQIPATGFNYKKHIEEMKVLAPTEPEVFLKSMLSLTGPFDLIRLEVDSILGDLIERGRKHGISQSSASAR